MGWCSKMMAKVVTSGIQDDPRITQTYHQVVNAQLEDENQQRQAAQIESLNLCVFSCQSIFALCELPFRIMLHGTLAAFYTLLGCCVCNAYVQFNSWRQQLLFHLYLFVFPSMIIAFVCLSSTTDMTICRNKNRRRAPPDRAGGA